MKFQCLATVSAFLTLTLAGPINVSPPGVNNFQLSCNGTSAAECNKAWWSFCSAEGNIIMAAPHKWKSGDCTDLHCNCIDTPAPKPKPTLIESATTTTTFTRPTDTLPPKTVTLVPGTTPVPGSAYWK